MKKIIAAALLLVLAFSMFGCDTAGPPTRGSVTDGVYKNEFFGLSYTIPEGWRALTDAEYQEKFFYTLPTNEELAEFDSEFEDLVIVKTTDETNYFVISYSQLFKKGSTDDQIKNMLAMKERDSNFGFSEYTKIGDVEYSYISSISGDGAHVIYYCWSTEMQGKFRQLFKFILSSEDSFENMLSGFSLIEAA